MIGVERTPQGERKICLILYAATGVLVSGYAAGTLLVGTSIAADPAWGFLILDAMQGGAAFNHWIGPDPEDIARDESWFMAAWAPGQYLVPAAVQRIGHALGIGVSLGQSCNIVIVAFSLLGLVGWHRLYRVWGFRPLSCAIAVAVIAGTREFSLPFGIYNGGEVLMFGALPWFTLVVWKCRELTPRQALLVGLAIVLLVATKLTGLVFALAALAAIVVPDLWPPTIRTLRRPATALAVAIVLCLLFHEFWMSKGWTAGDTFGFRPERLLTHSLAGAAAALTSMLSLGDMVARLQFGDGHATPLFPMDWLYLALSIPALLLLIFVARRLNTAHPAYVRFVLATAAIYLLILTFLHVREGLIFVEDRHYRPIGLLLLIGVVEVFVSLRRPAMIVAGAAALASFAYGIASYAYHLEGNRHRPFSEQGYRYLALTPSMLDFMRTAPSLRADRSRSAVVVPLPEYALALRGARVIVVETSAPWQGRVDHMTVIVPQRSVADGTASEMLDLFTDYDRSRWLEHPSRDFTYFVQ